MKHVKINGKGKAALVCIAHVPACLFIALRV